MAKRKKPAAAAAKKDKKAPANAAPAKGAALALPSALADLQVGAALPLRRATWVP